MNKGISILVSLAFIIVTGFAQKKEEKLVRKSFDRYKSSILKDKGEEAVKYVDSRTINYYSRILEITKHGDSTMVDSLNLMDKLMIFSIRHRTSSEDILSFDGRGFLIHAIKEGMVGKSSVAENKVGEVNIDGDFAKGQLISSGEKAPFYFHFYKEDDQWRLDLTSIFSIGMMVFEKMQEASGLDENEYLFTILESLTSKKPGKEIWKTIE